jgi:hypothetical protein
MHHYACFFDLDILKPTLQSPTTSAQGGVHTVCDHAGPSNTQSSLNHIGTTFVESATLQSNEGRH